MPIAFHQVFEKPSTPAALVLYHVRRSPHIGRGDLVKETGLSQPTITRAVAALTNVGLIQERRDLINTSRPGRPVVPLEIATWPAVLIGVALDKDDAVIGCYDARGRMLKDIVVSEFAKSHVCADVFEYIIAAIHRIKRDLVMPVKSIALSASSMHWNDYESMRGRLEYEFSVPVLTSNAAAAIALAEIQHDMSQEDVFVLYSDTQTSAALINESGVSTPSETRTVSEWLEHCMTEHQPKEIVFSGNYFLDPENRTKIRAELSEKFRDTVKLRVTRPDLETLRTITHALAHALLNAHPIELAKS